jgi:hypothetical protein
MQQGRGGMGSASMGAVAMRPSRRDTGCGRGSTPSGGWSLHARRPNISAQSASCFPAKNRADPEDFGAAMPIDRAELGVPAALLRGNRIALAAGMGHGQAGARPGDAVRGAWLGQCKGSAAQEPKVRRLSAGGNRGFEPSVPPRKRRPSREARGRPSSSRETTCA